MEKPIEPPGGPFESIERSGGSAKLRACSCAMLIAFSTQRERLQSDNNVLTIFRKSFRVPAMRYTTARRCCASFIHKTDRYGGTEKELDDSASLGREEM